MTPTRTTNYLLTVCRRNFEDEVNWVRIEDLPTLVLPRPLVVVNGCFDILHSGHMKVLWAARARATLKGTVVVAMDSDNRVKELKGLGHPIQTWIERATSLNYTPIDLVVEFDTTTDLQRILTYLDPDCRAQGSDHSGQPSASPDIPKMWVGAGGMRTSTIIDRCQKLLSTKEFTIR